MIMAVSTMAMTLLMRIPFHNLYHFLYIEIQLKQKMEQIDR